MRRITVDAYQVALIFRRGKLIEILSEGRYWIGFGKDVHKYNMNEPVHDRMELSVLLENEWLSEMLEITTISDNELGFEMKDGLFNRVLQPGRYAYWNGPVKYEVTKTDLSNVVLILKGILGFSE